MQVSFNRVDWYYVRSSNGQRYALTASFYAVTTEPYAVENFKTGRFEFNYEQGSDGRYNFVLHIRGN